ncbi:MAG: cytochrome b/b6 domain-containing protein, partial [Methylobacter sp.]
SDNEKFWEEIHEFFANFTLLLVFVHILGVAIESYIHKENLVKAMWNGYKRLSNNERRQKL